MAAEIGTQAGSRRFAHLSNPDPSWQKVAAKQQSLEKLADGLYCLPMTEFRKVAYGPPPLPANAPVIGTDITVEQAEISVRDGARIGLRVYRPIEDGSNRLLFFNIHGGAGWTFGTPDAEEAQNRLVAAKNKAVVVSVDYRRAPEHPFPYALHDAQDAFFWCKENCQSLDIDPEKIMIGGGSAGANAAVLAHMARDEGTTGIIGQILNIPVTCHPDHFPASKHKYHSFEQNAHAPIVNASHMRMFWHNYLPKADSNPLVSPLLAQSFAGLPPALVQVAGMDPLRDEGLAYVQKLKAGGVDVTVKIYEGLPHAFYIYPDLPPSGQYFQTMVDWIEHLLSNSNSNSVTG
ncbi:lipase esterase family protein [Ilyonectria robusta]|uniref:lipase esterase family protein n=1 Tax=Ilyonectria robusta TaxID=1079257 RepID=UPI001E8DD973|nr:lipase esterase family protein [Ilyonectria robusta]KAH8648237.1 lipase esterase family protein [Ilyonectria robusta]